MNIDDHVKEVLAFFDQEAGILGEILFVGAWARYFYRGYFTKNERYYPRLATKDLDILLTEKSKHQPLVVNVHQKLIDSGYDHEFLTEGLIKYSKEDLEIEFLIPTNGEWKIVPVKAYNVKAQQLPYMGMLWNDPVEVQYDKFHVRLPNPYEYALHKLIVSQRRAKKPTGEQDRKDAEEVLTALAQRKDFQDELKRVYQENKFNSKTTKMIKKSITYFIIPDFRSNILAILNDT